jgi:diguanylate cyclase (GGDEF)-like protein
MGLQPGSSTLARATMGRVAGLLFSAGAVITVLGIAFPHSPKADVDGFWGIAAGTAAVATLLFGWRERLPTWSFQGFMVLATVIISLSLYFNGERLGGPAADNEVLYIWVALYSGYFFTRIQMIAQLAVVAVALAAALVLVHAGQVGFTRWFITVGMISGSGLIVHVLKSSNDELIERLFQVARTDRLTGLVNRRGFDERLELELERSRRTEEPVALVLADIDHFKEVNDRFGHPAGDAVLTAVGRAAQGAMRKVDTMARLGGDEFALILPSTEAGGAFEVAERLRREVPHLFHDGRDSVTMSFGIVEFPLDGGTRERLLEAADGALYRAKGLGRNRSVVRRVELADDALQAAATSG